MHAHANQRVRDWARGVLRQLRAAPPLAPIGDAHATAALVAEARAVEPAHAQQLMEELISQRHLADVGRVIATMQAFATHVFVQRYGCHLIDTLLCHTWAFESPPDREAAAAAGAIDAVVGALSHHRDDKAVQEAACRALIRLLADCPANQQRAAATGGARAALDATLMQSDNKVVQAVAHRALLWLDDAVLAKARVWTRAKCLSSRL